jgi:hypothetical protein
MAPMDVPTNRCLARRSTFEWTLLGGLVAGCGPMPSTIDPSGGEIADGAIADMANRQTSS